MPSEEAEPTVKELTGLVMYLTKALAESHAHCAVLIASLRCTELSQVQKSFITTCSEAMAKSQNAFLKTFGDWNEPGNN
jgi:hypothetical protein